MPGSDAEQAQARHLGRENALVPSADLDAGGITADHTCALSVT